jgi:hypothetical protein
VPLPDNTLSHHLSVRTSYVTWEQSRTFSLLPHLLCTLIITIMTSNVQPNERRSEPLRCVLCLYLKHEVPLCDMLLHQSWKTSRFLEFNSSENIQVHYSLREKWSLTS